MARPALAATRAVDVLNFLAAHPTEAFTLSDLSVRVGINGASAHALLGVLTEAGYVARHPRLRTYTLGASVVALGNAALEHHPAIDLARDAARRLSDAVGLEVTVTAATGKDIVFLARAGERRARGRSFHVGQRVPLVPPLGSVFLAWADDERSRSWIARSADPGHAREVLTRVRDRGYAVALEGEGGRALGDALDHLADDPADPMARGAVDELVAELGRSDYDIGQLDPGRTYDLSMIAAPVFDTNGDVVLAIALVGFEPGLTVERIAACGAQVRDVGLVLTKRTRGRIPVAA